MRCAVRSAPLFDSFVSGLGAICGWSSQGISVLPRPLLLPRLLLLLPLLAAYGVAVMVAEGVVRASYGVVVVEVVVVAEGVVRASSLLLPE